MDVVAASLGAKVLTPGGTRPGLWTENIEPADENVGGGGSALAVAAESGVSLAWELDKVREWAVGAVALKPAPIPGSGGAEVYYYHTDHLGTPRALTDESQQVVWRGDFTPFGTVLETVNQVANPLRFPGQYFDAETGLHYNYFRDYDPGVGRYTQSDLIGLQGGLNTYLYVDANPTTFFDPDGRIKRRRIGDADVTVICEYYNQVCKQTGGKCNYPCNTAPFVCRNPDFIPSLWVGVSNSQIFCIRTCLIEEDRKSRSKQDDKCNNIECLANDVIEDYHLTCYTRCGVPGWRFPGLMGFGN